MTSAAVYWSNFYWSEYPFVMNAEAKSAILELDSQLKMQIRMQRTQVIINPFFQFVEIPYFVLQIR